MTVTKSSKLRKSEVSEKGSKNFFKLRHLWNLRKYQSDFKSNGSKLKYRCSKTFFS